MRSGNSSGKQRQEQRGLPPIMITPLNKPGEKKMKRRIKPECSSRHVRIAVPTEHESINGKTQIRNPRERQELKV